MTEKVQEICRAAARHHKQSGTYMSFSDLNADDRRTLWDFVQENCMGGGYADSWRGGGRNDTFVAYKYRVMGFRIVRLEESEGAHTQLVNWGLPAIQHPASQTTTFIVKDQVENYLIDHIAAVWL